MASLTSSTVLSPSDLLPILDKNRVFDLCVDEGETRPNSNNIDSNARALALAREAWYHMTMACRRGDIYEGRELIDLANDSVRGRPLIGLVARIWWGLLLEGRVYTEPEPQANDPRLKRAEEQLEQLRQGERIFVLDGVTQTDSDGASIGTYANEKGEPTTLQVGQLGQSDCSTPDDRFWACTNPCQSNSNLGVDSSCTC